MAQEYTLQPSPRFQTSRNVFNNSIEGTWTPEISFGIPGDLSITYTTQLGTYTRINNLVHVQFYVEADTFTHSTAEERLGILNLPIAPVGALSQLIACGNLNYQTLNLDTGYTQLNPLVEDVGTFSVPHIFIHQNGSGKVPIEIDASNTVSGGVMQLSGWVTYLVSGKQ